MRRLDDAVFTPADASDALYGFQVALSFALGRWVAPALPVGFDAAGSRAWEQWVPWRCDKYGGFANWWDTHTGDDLADFVHRFMRSWTDPSERDLVLHMAHHLISANHGGTTLEARIMLAQAAIEYLGWVTFVLSGRLSRRQYKEMRFSGALHAMLDDARIPSAIPVELEALRRLAAEEDLDGPRSARGQ